MSVKHDLEVANEETMLDLFRKRRRMTVEEAAKALNIKELAAEAAIERLLERGVMLHLRGIHYELDRAPEPGATKDFIFTSDAKGRHQFGFCSDQHICSKYSRLDVLNDVYDKFADAGIKSVLNAGNWIDGEARFNKHDLLVHGVDDQCRELVKEYPRKPGIKNYAIAGDDHEGWYSQNFGIDIGDHAQTQMRKAGRRDWENLGYMEAFITLRHRESGAECKIMVMHPGGGSAYAISYQPQKIVESFSGGEKPAAVLIGHYHKASYQYTRNTHTVQCGCTQDQTPFMRKKRLEAHVGGGIVSFTQDPKTGALIGCTYDFWNYFVRGYYNGRWSHSGSVVQAGRM